MGRMIGHAEASELLGAYALDAVDPQEAAAVEAHLESCPRCRAELRSHREVVGVLAYAGQEAPEGLWDRVVARMNDPDDDAGGGAAGPALSLRLERGGAAAAPAAGPLDGSRRRSAAWARVAGLAAAAAVVVIALLGVEVVRLQHRTDQLSSQVASMAGEPTMTAVHRALATPGARLVALKPASGGPAAVEAVILPSGQGYLYDARLNPLSPDRTYQLWGVVGGQRISYGVLGPTLAPVMAFRASSGVRALAVTAEVAGGVVSSVHQPVAVGFLG